ncbi:Oxoglutarate/iron-dependent dioxygenase [Arabidopsis suecica]|uniref:Oxoglutarate/iron-dependent dioxygenase n=1 Tax=Arabidopsis suecica TaxID=45249 RepID=A0A8T2FB36_ARASU|nr:Oxoglutarate/iron-dependent dioxygenase [Arabidopsis suecica]
MKVLKNEKHQGYSPVLSQISDNQIHGDYKESFFIGIEGSNDTPFCRANIWPNPDVLSGWQATMEKYHQEALRVCKAIARVLALALNVDGDYFDTPEMLGNPLTFMRLLHYEGMSDPSKGIYGCGPHSDFGMMTLLGTDSVMGLQICKDRDVKPRKWEYILSIKGAYIVNIGDLLERWSNGIFKSTLHRVLGNGQDRYSISLLAKPIRVYLHKFFRHVHFSVRLL